MIKAFLLDVDGTLVDSNRLHASAWVDALRDAGFHIPMEEVLPLIGMGADNFLPRLLGIASDDPLGKELADYRGELFRKKYLSRVRPFKDTRRLLKHLRKQGYTLIVATSSSKEDMEKLLRQGGISVLLPLRVNADDVQNSKPDPDIVQAALKKARISKDEAVMIGDTPYDVAAAGRAGVSAIAFTCGGWDREHLKDAVEIYSSPSDMLSSFENMREHYLGQEHYI